MKTHRGAAKRFRLSGSGKVLRRKGTANHMLTKKSSGRKRRVSGMAEVEVGRKVVRRLIGQ